MLSFCKIPSSFASFIKPRPFVSHPARLISSLLLPRFQVKQKHMLRRHRKWRWGRDPPPTRAPAGRRPVPSAAWSGSQNLPKGETGNTSGGYKACSESGGWPLIKGIRDEEKNGEGKKRQYYITFSLLKRRHSGFTGPKRIIRGRFNFNKCGLVFWLQASFDLCLNICIRLYRPFPKIHIQGHPRWIYFVLILHWHDMVQWDNTSTVHKRRNRPVQLNHWESDTNFVHHIKSNTNCTRTSATLNNYAHNVLVRIFLKGRVLSR